MTNNYSIIWWEVVTHKNKFMKSFILENSDPKIDFNKLTCLFIWRSQSKLFRYQKSCSQVQNGDQQFANLPYVMTYPNSR